MTVQLHHIVGCDRLNTQSFGYTKKTLFKMRGVACQVAMALNIEVGRPENIFKLGKGYRANDV